MSFLNLRRKKVEKKEESKHLAVTSVTPAFARVSKVTNRYAEILRRPRITEKALEGGERGVYVFEVARFATKPQIREAVSALYKVLPRKVTIAALPRKQILVKGKVGWTGGGKKAYVYLKKGEKIELV